MKTVAIACLAVAASAQGSIRVRPTSKSATSYSKADLARGKAAVAATGATTITGTINAMGPQVFFGGNDYDNILKDDFSSLITSTMVATTLDGVFPTYEAPVTMPAPAPVFPTYEAPVTMPAPVTFPSYTPPVETFTFPTETFTFPTYTPPAVETFTFPTYTPPAVETFTFPTYTPPAVETFTFPTYTPPAVETFTFPTYTPPAPVYTPPAPMYTPPAPVYTPPAPVYTPPVETYSWETEWTSTPIYTSPVETFTFPTYTPPVAPVETFTWDFPTYTPPVSVPVYTPPEYTPPMYTPPVYTPPAFTETFTFPVVPGAVDYGMTGPGETIVYASTSPSEFKPNIKGTGGPRTMSTMYGF